MIRRLYDLVGCDDRRFSPNCWRSRLALAHKGLEVDTVPVRFTEKDRFAHTGSKTVPVLEDGDRTVATSWEIAVYLDEAYPDRPALMGDAHGRALTRFIDSWADTMLHPAMTRCILLDIHDHLDPADRPYFRETREKRFGAPLEEVVADADGNRARLNQVLSPVRALLQKQPWIAGTAPAYADYLVVGAFQWARCISPRRLLEEDDPVREWRDRTLGLHGGLADTTPCYST